jgi:hypothetical protein
MDSREASRGGRGGGHVGNRVGKKGGKGGEGGKGEKGGNLGSEPASKRRSSQTPAALQKIVDLSNDKSHQQCGLGALGLADSPVVQLSEWNGELRRGDRIACRTDKIIKGDGCVTFEWRVGVIRDATTDVGDAGKISASVEFFNRVEYPGMDASAKASTEIFILEKSKFGDGTYLQHNWFIVVTKRDHLEAQAEAAKQAHVNFRMKFCRKDGTAIPNGQCGASTLAQFEYGDETPESMHRVRLSIAWAFRNHTKEIARIIAGSVLSTEQAEAEVLARAEMHEHCDTRRACPQSQWIGGTNGVDFVGFSFAVPRPVYLIKEGYTGGSRIRNGIFSNVDIRTMEKLEDDAIIVNHVWNGQHFVPVLHCDQHLAAATNAAGPGFLPAKRACRRPTSIVEPPIRTDKNIFSSLALDDDSEDEIPGGSKENDTVRQRRAILLRDLASKAQIMEQYRMIQDKLIEFAERKKQGR